MSFKDVAGSHLLWVCVIVGIIIVAGLTVYYLIELQKCIGTWH